MVNGLKCIECLIEIRALLGTSYFEMQTGTDTCMAILPANVRDACSKGCLAGDSGVDTGGLKVEIAHGREANARTPSYAHQEAWARRYRHHSCSSKLRPIYTSS